MKYRCKRCGMRGVEVNSWGHCEKREWCVPIRRCEFCREFEHECVCLAKENLEIVKLSWAGTESPPRGRYDEYVIISRFSKTIVFRHHDKSYVEYVLNNKGEKI